MEQSNNNIAMSLIWITTTSPQSNLRRVRCSSADKMNSKLLGSHSSRMLTVRSRSCIWPPCSGALSLMLQWTCCVCFAIFFAHEFLFNPHFDLEPDYIIRKGIRHRIERYTVRTEILPIFHYIHPPNCPFPFDDHHQNLTHPYRARPHSTPNGIRI